MNPLSTSVSASNSTAHPSVSPKKRSSQTVASVVEKKLKKQSEEANLSTSVVTAISIEENLQLCKKEGGLEPAESILHLVTCGFGESQRFFQSLLGILNQFNAFFLNVRHGFCICLEGQKLKVTQASKSFDKRVFLEIKGPYPEKLIDDLQKKLKKLTYFPGGVELNLSGVQSNFGKGKTSTARISFSKELIQIEELSVVDLTPKPPYFCAKKEKKPFLILTSDGSEVKKFPISSPLIAQDLVVNLPANEKEWKVFFQTVIEKELIAFFEKKQDCLTLLALYQGLLQHDPKLALSIQNGVMERMQKSSDIFIPYESKEFLVRFHKNAIPIASELAAGNFKKFEALCIEKAGKFEKNPLALEGLKGRFIAGKAVIFASDDLLPFVSSSIKVRRVTSFGLNGLLFAPRSLLIDTKKEKVFINHARQSLKFSLIHRYGQVGQILPSDGLEFQNQFLFTECRPFFTPFDLNEEDFLKDGFKTASSENFIKFWDLYFHTWVNKILHASDKNNLEMIFVRDIRLIPKEKVTMILKSRIVIWGGKFWLAKKNAFFEKFLPLFDKKEITAKEMDLYFQKPTDFLLLHSSDVSKILFCWLLKCYGIKNDISKKIFFGNQPLWPFESNTPTLENLILLFYHLLPEASHYLPKSLSRFTPMSQRSIICLSSNHMKVERSFDELATFYPYEINSQQNFTRAIYPLLLLRNILLKDEGFTPSLKESIERTFVRMMHSLHHFLNVHDNKFGYSYGLNPQATFFEDRSQPSKDHEFYVEIHELFYAFCQIREKPSLFFKLLKFFEEGFLLRHQMDERDRILSKQGKPPFFGLLAYNHLTHFCKLLAIPNSKKFLIPLLENAKSIDELFFLCLILYKTKFYKFFETLVELGQETLFVDMVKNAFFYIQKEVIFSHNLSKELINSEFVEEVLLTNHHAQTLSAFFTDFFEGNSATVIQDFLPAVFLDKLKKATTLKLNDLQSSSAQSATLENDLVKLELAISTAPFHKKEALKFSEKRQKRDLKEVLSFALKGALSRLKTQKPENKEISFSLTHFTFEDDEPRLGIKITDGANFRNFTAVFDFLQNEGAPLCEGSSRLSLLTTFENGKSYYLRIIPLRMDGIVYDLQIKCIEVPKEPAGTVLTILLYEDDKSTDMKVKIQALRAERFLREVLSLTHMASFQLVLKSDKEEILSKETVLSVTFGEMTFTQLRQQSDSGYVLMNGFPWMPLSQFLNEYRLLSPELSAVYSNGWILSLTKMHAFHLMASDLASWFFYLSFSNEDLQNYFHQFSSCSGLFEQIKPIKKLKLPSHDEIVASIQQESVPSSALEVFFNYFNFQKSNFIDLLEDCYKNLIKPLNDIKDKHLAKSSKDKETFKKECQTLVTIWKSSKLASSNPIVHTFLVKIVFPWVEKKLDSFYDIVSPNHSTAPANSTEVSPTFFTNLSFSYFLPFVKEALESYASLFQEYVPGQKISILFICVETKPLAWYHDSSKSITINLAKVKYHEILLELLAICERKPLAKIESEWPLFLPRGQCSGLFHHELEHARRAPDVSHSETTNSEGQMVHFESAAADYARVAHRAGLLDKFAQDLKGMIVNYRGQLHLSLVLSTMKALSHEEYIFQIEAMLKKL